MNLDSLSAKNGVCMDEALSNTKFGLFNYTLIFLSGVILIATFVEGCGIAYVIPVSQCDFDMSSSEKGVLGGISFFGVICSSFLWGYLADTKGRHRVITPTLLIAFLLTLASSFVQNFYLFVTLRFLNGFFISGSSATIYAYLGEFHDSKHRASAIMGSAIIFGVACFLVPFCAWIVINQDWQFDVPLLNITYKPWRLFLVVCGLPGLLAYFMLLFLPESPKFVLSQGNEVKAYEILRKVHRINNGKSSEFESLEIYEEPESIENRQRILDSKNSRFPLLTSIWIQSAPLFKPPHLLSTVLVCTVQFGNFATGNGFYLFFADILNKMASNLNSFVDERIVMCDVINMKPVNQTEDTFYEVCVTKLEPAMLEQGIVLESIYMLGFIVIGLIINRIGKFPIICFVSAKYPLLLNEYSFYHQTVVILTVSGCGGILCVLTDIPIVQICSFITLMCCAITANIINAVTVDIYPTSLRAMAVCIALMFGRLGCVIGANIVAVLLEDHCESVFYLSGSSLLAISILAYFIPNIHRNVDKPVADVS